MGQSSGKGYLSPEAVETLCQKSYAAGVEDTSMEYTALMESVRRQHYMETGFACVVTFWFTYFFAITRRPMVVKANPVTNL